MSEFWAPPFFNSKIFTCVISTAKISQWSNGHKLWLCEFLSRAFTPSSVFHDFRINKALISHHVSFPAPTSRISFVISKFTSLHFSLQIFQSLNPQTLGYTSTCPPRWWTALIDLKTSRLCEFTSPVHSKGIKPCALNSGSSDGWSMCSYLSHEIYSPPLCTHSSCLDSDPTI